MGRPMTTTAALASICCVASLLLLASEAEAGTLDLRVTKGFGTKAYDQIRVSVISSTVEPPVQGFFDYSAPFRYRWTQNNLHTAMKTASPGAATTFELGLGSPVNVRLPRQGEGVAGVLIADPCTDSRWLNCAFREKFQTQIRTPALLSAFVGDNATDFWGIYGDNFYDRTGDISADVFSRISPAAKAKLFTTVAGNHDFWVHGSPPGDSALDQCGNGHMQYYAQDSKAAETLLQGASAAPFNFSIDPAMSAGKCSLPSIDNFFWYNQIGNVALVGQAGAYSLKEASPFMAEACSWLGRQQGVEVAVLVGHWDIPGLGASAEMAMPMWYSEMAKVPGCAEFAQRGMLKYVMGHTHCNQPHPHGNVGAGFMVAGFGMPGCGNYGIPILDTTASRVRMWYFDTSSDAKYNAAITCVQQRGWRSCANLAELWLDQPIVPARVEEVIL